MRLLLSVWSDWDVVIWNSAISSVEDHNLGLNIFRKMAERDIVSYNTIISSYGFHGHARQALLLFDEMKSLAMRPSGATFVGLLSACSHAGLVDEGRSLYHSMVVDYGIRPNVEHYSCMVDLLGRAGRIGDACDIVRAMPEEPNASVLGCLLAACRLHNVDLIGEDILQDKLDDSGYHILISNMYASRKRWRDASRVRALIKEKGLRKKPGKSWTQIGHHTHVFDDGDSTHSEFGIIQETLKILFSEMRKGYHF
ncbi:pentatricopeptide repeat-containing protein At4g02750-like [Salvia splendens]|uniref:pentatricopeptide repeat-containing protein At4g02750-like n=1 Tax=Salvia splendens TaxID=180675 RepID=UPI001100A521|nr:pentatricopeptide repeat-containing protein At4g02750-like [Salvia splendens]